MSFCKDCYLPLSSGHLCFMQPLQKRNIISRFITLFYDFQTQREVPDSGDEEKMIHIINLCVAHQMCHLCIDYINRRAQFVESENIFSM